MPFMPKHPDSFAGQILLSVIDKLVLSLLAAVIVFSVQKCAQDADDERQQRIAAARLESKFVADALDAVTDEVDGYYQIASKLVNGRREADTSQSTALATGRVAVENALDLLVALVGPKIVNEKGQKSFDTLVDNMSKLNRKLRSGGDDNGRGEAFDKVKKSYRESLRILRDAALAATGIET